MAVRRFEAMNRGKKGIVIDLRKPQSRPVMEALIAWCDVLCENFRSPKVLERFGYGYEQCRLINPTIIYARKCAVCCPCFLNTGLLNGGFKGAALSLAAMAPQTTVASAARARGRSGRAST